MNLDTRATTCLSNPDPSDGEAHIGDKQGVSLRSMKNTTVERIEWLWSDMIAKGKLHVFAGDSGIGKTLILTSISAIVSRGGVFPGTKLPCRQGKVVYLSGEDGLEDTIVPRLIASGAHMDNLIALSPLRNDGELINLSTDLDDVSLKVRKAGDVRLFILDPVTAFCGNGFDNDSVSSVRRITTKLTEFAATTGAAVIALQHLTKNHQNRMKNRILGSGAWVHGPRIVLGAIEQREHGPLFGKIKANITDTSGVYPYRIDARDIAHDGVTLEDVRYIDWLEPHWRFGQLHDYEDGLDTPIRGETGEKAVAALQDALSDGDWHDRKDVIGQCLEAGGMGVTTIKRAAEQLGIEIDRTNSFPSRTVWRLPNPQLDHIHARQ